MAWPADQPMLMLHSGRVHHRWARWSEKHAEGAKVFWPAVQELALHEKYLFVPDLFDLAKSISDAPQLKTELDRLVAEKVAGGNTAKLPPGNFN